MLPRLINKLYTITERKTRLIHFCTTFQVINPSFHRALPLKIFGRLSQKMLDTIETEKDDGKLIDICDITQRWALDVKENKNVILQYYYV